LGLGMSPSRVQVPINGETVREAVFSEWGLQAVIATAERSAAVTRPMRCITLLVFPSGEHFKVSSRRNISMKFRLRISAFRDVQTAPGVARRHGRCAAIAG
jgi:hypothetical protein